VKPYYADGLVTIFHGDCREVLPRLEAGSVDVCITDPVWPATTVLLAGSDDPAGLFAGAAALLPRLTSRLVVQLGCDSDPRFLLGVPPELPFFRACWLEYARPGFKGRLLYTGDVAYAFGPPPRSRPGAHLIPGRFLGTDAVSQRLLSDHPCVKKLSFCQWLVKWFASGLILDCFAGTGTTLVAAKGRRADRVGENPARRPIRPCTCCCRPSGSRSRSATARWPPAGWSRACWTLPTRRTEPGRGLKTAPS